VDDVAAAAAAAVGNPIAAGRAFNLVDCYARWADWAAIACDVLGASREIDLTSPASPRNSFSRDAARELGVRLDRGHEGIRSHLRALIRLMDTAAHAPPA
jgi:nucleoside-diphosphate-sugar epimerase